MYRFTLFISFLLINPLFADSISFKQAQPSTNYLHSYGMVITVVFILFVVLAHSVKRKTGTTQKCKIIERVAVYHKTRIYIIDYQNQQFLIADNQNSLAIQPLQTIVSRYEHSI